MSTTINQNISYLFNILGFKRSDFAYHIGVSNRTLNSWIEGNTIPSTESLYEICSNYGVSADFLFGFESYPFRPNTNEDFYVAPTLISISDLTSEQKDAILMTLRAFRTANEAVAKEA